MKYQFCFLFFVDEFQVGDVFRKMFDNLCAQGIKSAFWKNNSLLTVQFLLPKTSSFLDVLVLIF